MLTTNRHNLLAVILTSLLLLLGVTPLIASQESSKPGGWEPANPTPAWPFPTPSASLPTPALLPFPTPPPGSEESRPTRPQATTWYVDASVPASGDGLTPATAFKTIGEATAVAQSGDTIRVAAGLYAEALSLPPGVQMIGAGWPDTTIDAGGAGTVLYQGTDSLLEGFTLTGSGGEFFDTGVWTSVGPATLRNNRFTGNHSGISLWCFDADCPDPVEFRNNIFDHNTMAGIASNSLHHFSVVNNTFVDNGTALPATRNFHTVVNNVIVGNDVGINGETGYTPVAHHNLVWGNGTDYLNIGPGTGDVDADPLFVDADNDDYSLLLGSPGRDAGDPAAQYNDLDGTRNDVGAFGGPFLIDYSPPPTPLVDDRGAAQPFTTTLHITWEGYDLQSGIVGYQVTLGTAPGADDTVPWAGAGTTTAYTFTALSLTVGETYYASVQGQNGMGDWSPVGSSDGLLIDPLADDALHQFCQAHYLKNLTEPLAEADSTFNVDLRKAVRQEVGLLIRTEPSPQTDRPDGLLTMTGLLPDQVPTRAAPEGSPSEAQENNLPDSSSSPVASEPPGVASEPTAASDPDAAVAKEIVNQLLRHTRYLLTLKGRPPFHQAGSEAYQRLQGVVALCEELLAHRHDTRLSHLHQGLQAALLPLADQYQYLQQGATWLQEIDHILAAADAPPPTSEQVAQQLRSYLDDLLSLSDLPPLLDAFRRHLDKVSKSYWPGLFHCYDQAELPRTNNDLESHFRDGQRRLLRTTGQKGQTRRTLHRFGAWELLPRPATDADCLAALRQVSPEQLAKERQRLNQHRERFRLHTRSTKQTRTQFNKLRQQWLALAATSSG